MQRYYLLEKIKGTADIDTTDKAAQVLELIGCLVSREQGNRNYKWQTPAALWIWILFF